MSMGTLISGILADGTSVIVNLNWLASFKVALYKVPPYNKFTIKEDSANKLPLFNVLGRHQVSGSLITSATRKQPPLMESCNLME